MERFWQFQTIYDCFRLAWQLWAVSGSFGPLQIVLDHLRTCRTSLWHLWTFRLVLNNIGNVSGQFWPFHTFTNHFGQFWNDLDWSLSVLDHYGILRNLVDHFADQLWTNLKSFGTFQTSIRQLGTVSVHFWTITECFGQFWSVRIRSWPVLDHFGQFRKNIGPLWTDRLLSRTVQLIRLPYNFFISSLYSGLITEILAGWILLPLASTADTSILHNLLLILLGGSSLTPYPPSSSENVEFLSAFAGSHVGLESNHHVSRKILHLAPNLGRFDSKSCFPQIFPNFESFMPPRLSIPTYAASSRTNRYFTLSCNFSRIKEPYIYSNFASTLVSMPKLGNLKSFFDPTVKNFCFYQTYNREKIACFDGSFAPWRRTTAIIFRNS